MKRWLLQTLVVAGLLPGLRAGAAPGDDLNTPPVGATAPAEPAASKDGKKERPFTPGGKWRAHDMKRPQPRVVAPGSADRWMTPAQPPSDAIVLFDGKDLSRWQSASRGKEKRAFTGPRWKVEDGYMEIVPRSGSLFTKEKFADCQIHLEWATPAEVKGSGQGRGNSGFFIAGHPEIQVLDSYENATYPDGQAVAIYGQYPPLVNASRKPGEWQSLDIIYQAPRLDPARKVIQPAYYTVFHNGVLVHHHVEVPGSAVECAIGLQDHGNPVRYRNIWLRKLKGYDDQ